MYRCVNVKSFSSKKAKKGGLLSSPIVVGSSEGAFLENIVRTYLLKRDGNENEVLKQAPDKFIAKVNGHLFSEDHEAIVSIGNQFMVRGGGGIGAGIGGGRGGGGSGRGVDNNFNVAMEDLEDHLKLCKQDRIPAVILLEEFQVFAKKCRQVLIYTLLDLMHR